MAQKFYAVREGRNPGIYLSWADCSTQVSGFSGAVYKSFPTREQAEQFLNQKKKAPENTLASEENKKEWNPAENREEPPLRQDAERYFTNEETAVAYVDGSFEKSLKKYAYGCVIIYKGKRAELSGSGAEAGYLSMNNVAGEILGSMNAIRWAIEHQAKRIHIYHDYEGIARWAEGDWKANKEGTKAYQSFISESRKKIEITFTKVAAHTGVELNERADRLAKKALGIN